MMILIECLLCLGIFSAVRSLYVTKIKGPQPIWNATYVDKLRKDLLMDIDKFARPDEHFNRTTVSFGMTIRHIEVDEAKSTLTVNCWLKLVWTDQKLQWNPDDYGGVAYINIADHEVWQPDIHLHNSVPSPTTTIGRYGGSYSILYYNGQVLWIPPAIFTVLCNYNFKYWPFDRQDCFLKFSSWTYNGDEINMIHYGNSSLVVVDVEVNNSEWRIDKTSQSIRSSIHPFNNETYPDVFVNITISRVSSSYTTIITTPAIAVVMMVLATFWLPPQAGEKILINVTTAIIICLILFYALRKVPSTRNETPLIVLFYSRCLYIIISSIITSVVVIMMSRMNHTKALPWRLKYPLTGRIGKALGLKPYIHQLNIIHHFTAEEMLDHQVVDFEDNVSDEHNIIKHHSLSYKLSYQEEWMLLGAAIDRISFVLYSCLFCILAAVYAI